MSHDLSSILQPHDQPHLWGQPKIYAPAKSLVLRQLLQLLLLQLAKSDGNYTAANISKAQCALRVEHVEKGGCHITLRPKALQWQRKLLCNYAERTIDVSCHMTSSQTWWNCESVKNKHGQRESGNAIWHSVQTRGSVLRHPPVLPSQLSAKSQKLLDLCLGDKHPETSAAWTIVEGWILWLHWIFRSYFFGSGKAELPLIPESVVMRGWSQIDAPCWLEKTHGSVAVSKSSCSRQLLDVTFGKEHHLPWMDDTSSVNLHIRQLVCKIWRDTKRPSPHLIRCPI